MLGRVRISITTTDKEYLLTPDEAAELHRQLGAIFGGGQGELDRMAKRIAELEQSIDELRRAPGYIPLPYPVPTSPSVPNPYNPIWQPWADNTSGSTDGKLQP